MHLTDAAVLVKKVLRIVLGVVLVYYVYLLIIGPGFRHIIIGIFVKPVPANPMYGLLDPLLFVEKPTAG
jgi:hypothetical protein